MVCILECMYLVECMCTNPFLSLRPCVSIWRDTNANCHSGDERSTLIILIWSSPTLECLCVCVRVLCLYMNVVFVYMCVAGDQGGLRRGAYHPHIQVPPLRRASSRPLTRFYETLPPPQPQPSPLPLGGLKLPLRNVNKRQSKHNTFYGRVSVSIVQCPASLSKHQGLCGGLRVV